MARSAARNGDLVSDTYEEVAGTEARTVEIAGARKLPVQVLHSGEWLKWKVAP